MLNHSCFQLPSLCMPKTANVCADSSGNTLSRLLRSRKVPHTERIHDISDGNSVPPYARWNAPTDQKSLAAPAAAKPRKLQIGVDKSPILSAMMVLLRARIPRSHYQTMTQTAPALRIVKERLTPDSSSARGTSL